MDWIAPRHPGGTRVEPGLSRAGGGLGSKWIKGTKKFDGLEMFRVSFSPLK